MVDFPLPAEGLVIVIIFLSRLLLFIEFILTTSDSSDELSFTSFSSSISSTWGITPIIGMWTLLSKNSAGFDIGKKYNPLMIAVTHANMKAKIEERRTTNILGLTKLST